MGRKKIAIREIPDERYKQVTFSKRKQGLFKKAYELSVLCGCEIGIIVFSQNNRLSQYSSFGMEELLLRYTKHASDPVENKINSEFEVAANNTLNSNSSDNFFQETIPIKNKVTAFPYLGFSTTGLGSLSELRFPQDLITTETIDDTYQKVFEKNL